MLPNPEKLIEKLELTVPIIGFYDAPEPGDFEPLVEPQPDSHLCVFKCFENWISKKTLHLTMGNCGCHGCGYWLFGKQTGSREEFLDFISETEGLKESKGLLSIWLDSENPYIPQYSHLFVGPLKEELSQYLKSVTFLVNPDQLSALMIGAHYYSVPDDPLPPVIASFGSGCMQLLPLFKDIDYPQAMVGATDIVMRQHLPPNILAFTVTLPLYRQLCLLDEHSFLYKPFLKSLKEARKKHSPTGARR
ncbi:MAG: DUF169 domain-containing protein [bacterium]|nr:DUF169 domain-containing protein [bacterium]